MSMSPLVYLSFKKLKNGFITMLRKPGQLIFTVFMVALLVFTIVIGGKKEAAPTALQNKGLLSGIIFLFYSLNALLVIYQGFKQGSTLFKMPDVNLLFASPINSINILFYGMIQQLASYIVFNIFLLYQYSWMNESFGISLTDIIIMILVFAILLLSSQLCSMLVYIFSAGNDKRKKLFKGISIGTCLALAAYVFISWIISGDSMIELLSRVSRSAPVFLFPISGWLTALVYGIVAKNYILALGFFALWLLFFLLGLRLIKTGRNDYYEDVLVSTELNFNRLEDARRGKLKDTAGKSKFGRKLLSGKTGLNKGSGASALYYKHRLENRRKNPLILGWADLFFAAFATVFSYFMRREGGVIAVAAVVFYIQIFTVAMGRLLVELQSHYIYLIPEKPFKKLLWGMMETMEKYPITAILITVPVSIILKLSVLEAVSFAFATISFSFLTLSLNLLFERIIGSAFSNAKGILVIFYLLAAGISVAPGVALGVFAASAINSSAAAVSFIVISVWNFSISLLYIFLSRNILQNVEYR